MSGPRSLQGGDGTATRPCRERPAMSLRPILLLLALWAALPAQDQVLLNVSYDPTRELYQALDPAFAQAWQAEHHATVTIRQSHGGSGAQARAVIEGLEADVVTLGLGADIDAIAKAGLLSPAWQSRLPEHASPYTSTIVFLVRRGNPKHLRDWSDLGRSDVAAVLANPKTSGGARWAFLAAWAGYLAAHPGDEPGARAFVGGIYARAPVLDAGSRGATLSFARAGLGDVLVGWENEAFLAQAEFADQGLVVITPSVSILAEPPVAVVDAVAARHGTTALAESYLRWLYTPAAQEIIAAHGYRPRDPAILARHAQRFPPLRLVTIDALAGGWATAQPRFFASGGVFDQIVGHGR